MAEDLWRKLERQRRLQEAQIPTWVRDWIIMLLVGGATAILACLVARGC